MNSRCRSRFQTLAALTPILAAGAITVASAPAFAQANKLTTLTSEGEWANDRSYYSVISDDGRYVAFQSDAGNLAGSGIDTNGRQDIYYRDILLGTTELVSIATNGRAPNSVSVSPAISSSGRYVAFCTDASNIVTGDSNGTWDVFVRDMQTGVTERVSVDSDGDQGFLRSDSPCLSANGRYVSFHTFNAFDPADTDPGYDVYIHDRVTGDTVLASTNAAGQVANGDCYFAQLSADATQVVFLSSATNLVTPDLNGLTDVYVKDLMTGSVVRANVSSSGTQANDETNWPYISGNGEVVVFSSRADNLVSGDSPFTWDLFAHILATGETKRLSVRPDGGQPDDYTRSPVGITNDGRYVTFASLAGDLVDDDTNPYQDIFVRDILNDVTVRAVFGYAGDEIDDDLFVPDITADGRYITYTAEAENLDVIDGNGRRDIYVADLHAALYFTQGPLVRGAETDFEVFAAVPGETVYVLYSLTGVGQGPCIPQLGGLCLDLRTKVKILGSAVADANGHATLTVRVPNNTPLIPLFTQAVAQRGPGGADSVKSHTQRGVVE